MEQEDAVRPVSPKEVGRAKSSLIPAKVVLVFNEMVAKNFDGYSARFRTCDVVDLLIQRTRATPQIIHDKHWLDIEYLFGKAGWEVSRRIPLKNEEFSFGNEEFTFTPKEAT